MDYNPKNADLEGKINETAGKVDTLHNIVYYALYVLVGLILVLIFAAGSWYSSYNAEKTATYLDLRDKVNEQNNKIDNFTSEIKNLEQLYGTKQQGQISQPIK
jgi:hypothetical protein